MAQEQKSGNANQADSRDTGRLSDYSKVGPTSIEGVEASDLPDKGRGDVFTDTSKEAGRKLPQQTGQWETGDTGLKGDPDIADADEHGHQTLI
jgi:hypothetical protein